MNLKALKEKRNDLLSEAEGLVAACETEVRSLTPEERAKFESLTDEIKQIDETIKTLESRRYDGEKIDPQEEERNMEQNTREFEVRALEQYLRKQDGEEVRALQTTSQGSTVIPENVEGTIILKMEETAPVFAMARKFNSVNGSLKIAKEDVFTDAGFVGEGADVAENAISFSEVKLTQKRVGAAISLSNQLINDSAVNIVDYAMNLLARRVGKAVEKSILTGSTQDEFVGIKGNTEMNHVDVSLTENGGAVTIDHLLDLYNSIFPSYLDGSAFIMSRPFFNQVAKLKDQMGHYYMQNGVVNGKLTYTLFGAPVIVTDNLDDASTAGNVPCIFGNIEESYAVMIKKGFALQHITADTTQAMRGSQLLVLDGYMDGALYNTQAIAKLNIVA